MDEDIDVMTAMMPGWFVSRMMHDNWSFGLVLVDGRTLVINCILAVHRHADGSLWMDVDLKTSDEFPIVASGYSPLVGAAVSDRTKASVAARHVLYAVELADT